MSKNQDAFEKFVDIIRKKEPFLRKATEQELQGIFVRLTPAERVKYSVLEPVKPRKSEPTPTRKQKKREKVVDDFIADEAEEEGFSDDGFISSDDVSLVSESANELVDEISEEPLKKEKKSKKEKKEKKKAKKDKKASSGLEPKTFNWDD